MAIRVVSFQESITPTVVGTELAQESSSQLANLLDQVVVDGRQPEFSLQVQVDGKLQEMAVIPESVFRLLTDVFAQISNGHAVTLMPVNAELTIRQAADILGVSRRYFINLLENEKIPYQGVGLCRRVRFDDLMMYKQEVDSERLLVLEELACEAQELDMGY